MKRAFVAFWVLFLTVPLFAQQSRPVQQSAQDDQSDRPKIDVESYSVEVTLLPQEHRLTGRQLEERRLRAHRKGGADIQLESARQADAPSVLDAGQGNVLTLPP